LPSYPRNETPTLGMNLMLLAPCMRAWIDLDQFTVVAEPNGSHRVFELFEFQGFLARRQRPDSDLVIPSPRCENVLVEWTEGHRVDWLVVREYPDAVVIQVPQPHAVAPVIVLRAVVGRGRSLCDAT
jgi:hypothetical protein